MAEMKNDLMSIAGLILGLFLIAIIVGVTYVGGGYFKDTLCTVEDSSYVWEGGECLNATGDTAMTVESIDNVDTVLDVVLIVLGLIGLVVIVLLFKIIIKTARGFNVGQ